MNWRDHLALARAADRMQRLHERAAYLAPDMERWTYHRRRARMLRVTRGVCLAAARAEMMGA